jgi:pimeloyl-ACP methyl ester carboxylesterase
MAEDTAGLMQALGIERARVSGISMGSAIAQELALAYPEKVHSLLLVSSWARCDEYTKAVFEHFAKMRAIAAPADFMQLLQLWIASPGYYQEKSSQMIEDQAKAKDAYMPLHAFVAQCAACSAHNSYDRLKQIKAPALLTVGDMDIFTPLRLSVEMCEQMHRSELLVFPGRGHIHHWEDLNKFNEAVYQFLLD